MSYESKSTTDWEATLGESLRSLRIHQGLLQEELASQANLSLGAIKNLEGGKGSTIKTLVAVLRALGEEEWLGTLIRKPQVSPLTLLKKSPQVRRRASRKDRDV